MISLAHKTPKILFVNPRFPRSLWGFQGIHDIVGVRCGQAPLGLATVAGMTPREMPVELQDENVEAINLDTDADVVAIGCWNVQYHRAHELAREFRRRGKMVVVGGPYPTLCPERFTDATFDVVFDGETEVTYRLNVELGVLLPGFVRTQGAKRVIENALERLKRRVELG